MVVGLTQCRRRLRAAGAAAPADPVRLRRQRHHAGHGDASHAEGRGPSTARSPSCTTRASAAEAVLSRRAGRDAGRASAARLHPIGDGGDLRGRFGADHLAAAMPAPEAVYVCGPPSLADAVRKHCDDVSTESFVPPVFDVPAQPSGGQISFSDSRVDRHRRRPPAAAAGRGRRPDTRKRMPDGHLPHLHSPQDPRRRQAT